MALLQLRPGFPADSSAVEWVSFASNAFNTMAPFYPNVDTTPDYLSCTTGEVSTDSFYWVSRMNRPPWPMLRMPSPPSTSSGTKMQCWPRAVLS